MKPDPIDLWNVRDGLPTFVGAQRVVNILGRASEVHNVEDLSYSLNDGPRVPVFFAGRTSSAERLAHLGDFNIDTLERDQLGAENQLTLFVRQTDGSEIERSVRLAVNTARLGTDDFRLDLNGVSDPQQVGQLVNGHWRVGLTAEGERCLEILPEDVGLDRIILFGDDELSDGYAVRARLRVNSWYRRLHSVGLLFKWNPHLQGDGTDLPSQWSTGLGYYYSGCRGLRIRIGVDVHKNDRGEKLGDHVLGEGVLSPWRYQASQTYQKVTRRLRVLPQVVPGRVYCFELKVHREEYALTVWPVGRSRPSPQVVVENPPELLSKGAAGVIAHQCAVQLFDFEVKRDDRTGSAQ